MSVVLGSSVRFLLMVFSANLKASSSAPEGPLSIDSKIPPVTEMILGLNVHTVVAQWLRLTGVLKPTGSEGLNPHIAILSPLVAFSHLLKYTLSQ